ncbi:hypothetical protein C1645_821854 [Glomus cerebriforme]|uniref:Uncharacterized protein n=1 Tax=Glomus cerebriforme TaxID=658196 RepID=A0A397T5M2_9GLOM|nr:hypothetical protein C1645_821854 [Glomus cerebriforme]
MAIGSVIYLTRIKKQSFFLPSTKERGWLRPRPLHSYHLIVVCFMFFQTIHLLALIYESYPTIAVAEAGNIAKNVVTNVPAVFFAISMVYSTPNVELNENDELLCKDKRLNKRLIDINGVILSLLPMITGFPMALLTVWQIIYIAALAYLYYKLMIIIKCYVKILEERNDSSEPIGDNMIEKITLPIMAIVNGLMFQAIVYITFGFTPRTTTIYYFGWNLFFYCIEYIVFPIIGFSVECFLIYYTIKNLKTPTNSSTVLSSSSEQTS